MQSIATTGFNIAKSIFHVYLARIVCTLAVAVCLSGSAARAEAPAAELVAWKIESYFPPALYAVGEPTQTNLNVASIVLACEHADDRYVIQFELYLTNEGPLLPHGADATQLKASPRAEVEIDDRIYPVRLLFGDDHAVLADDEVEGLAVVSEPLVDAMAKGKAMTLRLDLLAEPPGMKAAFDGAALIDLREDGGGAAIRAMQRCVSRMKTGPST